MEVESLDEITLLFSLNQDVEEIKCHIKERLINMIKVYCKIKRLELDSVFFLYGGSQITNLEITLDKLANRVSIANKEIKILVYYIPKSAKIIFSHSNNLYEKIKDTEENIESILSEYLIENSIDRNQVIFKYNNNIVYPDQTLSQFINRHAINFDNEKENNSDIEIEIKIEVIDIHEINKIISFSHSNEKYEDYYSIEKK